MSAKIYDFAAEKRKRQLYRLVNMNQDYEFRGEAITLEGDTVTTQTLPMLDPSVLINVPQIVLDEMEQSQYDIGY